MLSVKKAKQILTAVKRTKMKLAPPGEPWHKDYQGDDESFNKLIDATILTQELLLKTFKDIAKNDLPEIVNWTEYGFQLDDRLRAKQGDELLENLDSPVWERVTMKLVDLLGFTLSQAVEAGGQRAEQDVNIVIGWNVNAPAAQRFLRKYTLDLVTGLNETTRDRLRESLLSGLQNGLNQDQMTKKLTDVVVDEKRASAIANTEVIRAYQEGKIAAMNNTGLEYKLEWLDNQPDSCEICHELHGKRVKKGKKFYSTVTGKEYSSPPGPHPNCRCSTRIVVV